MLPPFLLPVTLNGQPKALIAKDLPVWAFFWGSKPDRIDDEWMRGLLTRAVVQPILTPEIVARLGDGFAEPALAYLLAVGHVDLEEVRNLQHVAAVGRAAHVGDLRSVEVLVIHPEPQLRVGVPLDAIRGPEHADTAKLIVAIAERVHVPPHVVWQEWSISDFYLTTRMLQLTTPSAWGNA